MSDQHKQVTDTVDKALGMLGRMFGESFADHTAFGSLMSKGSTNANTDRSYLIVMVTNDVVPELREWLEAQIQGRAQAAHEANLDLTVDPGTETKGKRWRKR